MDAAIIVTVVTTVLTFALAAWVVIALRKRQPADVTQLPDGGFAVPVRQLEWRGGSLFGGMTRNGITPKLAIYPDALRFKVFKETVWPLAELERIDAGRILFGHDLRFVGAGTLRASVASAAVARDVLRRLPSGLPLTAAARALRDG